MMGHEDTARLATGNWQLATLLAVALFASVSDSGCGDRRDDGSLRRFKLAVIPGAQDFVVYVMESRGLFDKYDLHPEKLEMLSPANLNLMLAEGKVDVGFAGFTTMAIARSQGRDVIVVRGLLSPVNLVFVPHASPVRTLRDLAGKKLGIFGGPASSTFTFFAIIAKHWFDLDPFEDMEMVTAPGPVLAELLERGEIDAALMGTTESLKFRAKNTYRVLLDLSEEYRARRGRAPAHVAITTSEAFAASHPALLADFVRAYLDAVAHARLDAEVWSEYGRRIGMESNEEIQVLREAMSGSLITDWDDRQLQIQREYLELAHEMLGEKVLEDVPEGLLRTVLDR